MSFRDLFVCIYYTLWQYSQVERRGTAQVDAASSKYLSPSVGDSSYVPDCVGCE